MRTIAKWSIALVILIALIYGGSGGDGFGNPLFSLPGLYSARGQALSCLIAGLLGAIVGAFMSDKFRKLRWLLYMIAGVLICTALLMTPLTGQTTAFAIGFVLAYLALSDGRGKALIQNAMRRFIPVEQTAFGSSRWATFEDVQKHGLAGVEGLFLGMYRQHHETNGKLMERPLYYQGDRHLMTVAASRAGKGVSSVVPNLLTYEGSVLAIDVKGELAAMTWARRGAGDTERGIEGMGQDVFIVDPFGTVLAPEHAACFNPMDWLDPSDPALVENAMTLWEGIIIPGAAKEPFWDEEAKSIGVGITLHVATAENEAHQRHFGRVRDIITAGPAEFAAVMSDMLDNSNPVVRGTAQRTMGKDEKLLSGVMATLQSHTHFLESDAIRRSLSRSDFRFEDLKARKMTVYLVLPADRLNGTFNRWLRLLIQQAITVNARNVWEKPQKPVLFILDELAALGKMDIIPRAYGLMAGYGMTLWSIVQNFSQLEDVYGKGWETFIGNSGILQYYGSRDFKTADYFSKLAGVTTAVKFSWGRTIGRSLGFSETWGTSRTSGTSYSAQGGSSSSSYTSSHSESKSQTDSESGSETHDVIQRPLVTADELMTMRGDEALVLVENLFPVKAFKVKWYAHPLFRPLDLNLEKPDVTDVFH